MGFNAVLFDWDGTLSDSIKQNFAVQMEIFTYLGLPRMSDKEFQDEYEADYRSYYQKKGINVSRLDEIDGKWHEFYSKYSDSVLLAPNAAATVKSLSSKGIKLGIVSNGYFERITGEMKKHGVHSCFETLVTRDKVPGMKPSPAGIFAAIESLGVVASKTLYVGDMVEDVRAGKNAGVATAAVATGLHSKARLAKENPDYLFSDIREVLELF